MFTYNINKYINYLTKIKILYILLILYNTKQHYTKQNKNYTKKTQKH